MAVASGAGLISWAGLSFASGGSYKAYGLCLDTKSEFGINLNKFTISAGINLFFIA